MLKDIAIYKNKKIVKRHKVKKREDMLDEWDLWGRGVEEATGEQKKVLDKYMKDKENEEREKR